MRLRGDVVVPKDLRYGGSASSASRSTPGLILGPRECLCLSILVFPGGLIRTAGAFRRVDPRYKRVRKNISFWAIGFFMLVIMRLRGDVVVLKDLRYGGSASSASRSTPAPTLRS